MAEKEIAVKVQDITKTFRIPLEASNGIKQKLINTLKGRKGYREFTPLKDISFEIKKGDFFGIVGRNGSGKSTLLKTIAGIYAPQKGLVQVNGKLVPFIELGVGFNPELTGRENVFLNGALLGFSRKEMEAMYDEIVDFAELRDFMDEHLKNYSSGMQVRLAFSIAIRAKADILLLDEVLAVGDESFQRKCDAFFDKIQKDKNKTVILVTHSMDNVRKYCNKAMMIRDGEIVAYGNPEKVANEYSLENFNTQKDVQKEDGKDIRKAKINAVINGDPLLKNSDTLKLKITYANITNTPTYIKVIIFYNNMVVMVANAKILYNMITSDTKEHTIEYEAPLTSFNCGEFSAVVLLVDEENGIPIADFGYEGELKFKINNVDTGTKIGGAMKNVGKMELK